MNTLANLLKDSPSGKTALIVPEIGTTMTYLELKYEIDKASEILISIGLNPGDTVSLVLGNRLDFIIYFLAITACNGVAAPLNPAYTSLEFKFYMEDASSKFLITSKELKPAIETAKDLEIPILISDIGDKGEINLNIDGSIPSNKKGPSSAPSKNDVALFLHTSGTTSTPKGVPLSHENLMISTDNIIRTYQLITEDTSLLVMPLFHVHGLIGVALSTLKSNGTLIIPPRFSASKFWSDATKYGATWYSAVPTIHQILLQRADTDEAPYETFRFIRSCSAALASSVFNQLESRFGSPVLEAYGMTEASHQMSSNHLPPLRRSPGTVGTGTGVDIAIMDEFGTIIGQDTKGEVVVKGANVTHGYLNNPDANNEAFVNGWFRTGDQGTLSADNTLTLTGRLKELINRGGEKISPLEVDAALLLHPAVSEAVSFGIADEKYGETIQAAVVISSDTTESDIRSFCSGQLASFKMPEKIHIVDELPRTATGKIQRRSIAAQFQPNE